MNRWMVIALVSLLGMTAQAECTDYEALEAGQKGVKEHLFQQGIPFVRFAISPCRPGDCWGEFMYSEEGDFGVRHYLGKYVVNMKRCALTSLYIKEFGQPEHTGTR